MNTNKHSEHNIQFDLKSLKNIFHYIQKKYILTTDEIKEINFIKENYLQFLLNPTKINYILRKIRYILNKIITSNKTTFLYDYCFNKEEKQIIDLIVYVDKYINDKYIIIQTEE
jgi:hypothetical protein